MNHSSPSNSRSNRASGPRSAVQMSSRTPRGSTKRNTSILNFFKKTDAPTPPKATQNRITQYVSSGTSNGTGEKIELESLFFEEDVTQSASESAGFPRRSKSPDNDFGDFGHEPPTEGQRDERYNEYPYYGSMKRRKVDFSADNIENVGIASRGPGPRLEEEPGVRMEAGMDLTAASTENRGKDRNQGPFVDEPDSDEDTFGMFPRQSHDLSSKRGASDCPTATDCIKQSEAAEADESGLPLKIVNAHDTPALEDQEDSSEGEVCTEDEVTPDVENCNAFDPDSFDDLQTDSGVFGTAGRLPDDEAAVCPICRDSLDGMTDTDASLHVNDCLDGNSTRPASTTTKATGEEPNVAVTKSERKLVARPAQRNPFDMGSDKPSTASAFSKLMSAKAEDSAWATAAASEVTSRGKQAYERTCPFYKILPGFSICVDAFRYGAVDGCNAYFLTHFHSDHYMGLTAKWRHGPIYCSRVTGNLVRQQLKVDPSLVVDIEWDKKIKVSDTGGVHVTMIPANHCPGSALFLFEKMVGKGTNPKVHRVLHCGDFRASPEQVQHPLLRPDLVGDGSSSGRSKPQTIDVCYLDTTYLNPKYGFPSQADVISACVDKCRALNGDRLEKGGVSSSSSGGNLTKCLTESEPKGGGGGGEQRLLVVIGTYSIGKERLCLGIARALKTKIYVPAAKRRICDCLEDEELSSLLTSDPTEAQVHMHSLLEIRADTLLDYLGGLKPHFTRVAGFRPTGWNYRPPAGRMTDSPAVQSVLYSDSWRGRFTVDDLAPQRGNSSSSSSSSESLCFSVPYSEHSSFRELTMFCCALRIGRVIPTVNVGSARSRERMKVWVDRWEAEKRKSGLFQFEKGSV